MKKIILSLLIILASLGVAQNVLADSTNLSVIPATASKTTGATFSVSVNLDPAGNKVCVVKGTLNFQNLTCQNITVASGLMAQTNPTCASPSFVLGIPKCSTIAQNLLSVSVKAGSAGEAKASFAGVTVIGAGVAVPASAGQGVYTVTAPVTKPKIETKPTTTVTLPVQKVEEQPAETVKPQPEAQPAETTNALPANTGAASLLSTVKNFITNPIVYWIIIIIIILLAGLWFFEKRSKKQ